MHSIITSIMAITMSTLSFGADINHKSLETLLNTPGLELVGDVHSHETVQSIYGNAVKGKAKIQNQCEVKKEAATAECLLLINYALGETALQYEVVLPGKKLHSLVVRVSRGD